MKVAPIVHALSNHPHHFDQVLVHTGQHYDETMSQVFFDELELPRPDLNLEVGSGTHAWQTAQVMLRFEPMIQEVKPDWVIVVGDVNSTLACSLVCSKLDVPVAHVEAGLRSFDRSMPEEFNRLLTDQIADLLFTPSRDGDENLIREGVAPEKIWFVGNVMIDTLVGLRPKAQARWAMLQAQYSLRSYVLVTLHRPSNVDDPGTLQEILNALAEIGCEHQIIFPVHPRTRRRIAEFNLELPDGLVQFIDPVGYLDFLALEEKADLVLTDSGGIQEETTFLGVPCLTARPNTERPVTITLGTNRLVESKCEPLVNAMRSRLNEQSESHSIPPFWDGKAAERISQVFLKMMAGRS
jgi:UDP-N-acetylglucosamine 2-epimerase (non-hydrolysing)